MDNAATIVHRRIVICLDGTSNEPGPTRTNVQRIYSVVKRVPGCQYTYYQPGVGTLEPIGAVTKFWRWILMLLDSANGWMMKRHACSAYEYLCDTYRPGDEIYLFGFSRGAQSARILAGMITTVGILHPGMREMVSFAWKSYTSWAPFSPLSWIGEVFGKKRSGRLKREYFTRARNFKGSFGQAARIRFMGLWDTVSSVGPPWNPVIYNYSDSNDGIDIVRHAVSLDEHRVNFEPRLWRQRAGNQDALEVWFPGVHADVGGGYGGRARETSKISLAWMLRELVSTTDIQLDTLALARLKLPDLDNQKAVGKAAVRSVHDELRKLGWRLLELVPFPRWSPEGRRWRLHLAPHLGRGRTIPAGAHIHESVFLKSKLRPGYRPVLPSSYTTSR